MVGRALGQLSESHSLSALLDRRSASPLIDGEPWPGKLRGGNGRPLRRHDRDEQGPGSQLGSVPCHARGAEASADVCDSDLEEHSGRDAASENARVSAPQQRQLPYSAQAAEGSDRSDRWRALRRLSVCSALESFVVAVAGPQ